MSLINISNDEGDTRYYYQYGTATVATITGVTLDVITCNGAVYHSMQFEALSFPTTTGQMVVNLEGSLDNATGTSFFVMNYLTITAIGTQLISSVEAVRHLRCRVASVNTSAAFSFDCKMHGNALSRGRV